MRYRLTEIEDVSEKNEKGESLWASECRCLGIQNKLCGKDHVYSFSITRTYQFLPSRTKIVLVYAHIVWLLLYFPWSLTIDISLGPSK